MKVLIVRRGTGTVDGVALQKYVPGEVYNVSHALADYLALEALALPEMRKSNRVKLKKKSDRRK